MVKVLRSLFRGPLEPHIAGFAEELVRRGYTQSSAGQHVCFLAHLDRWMSAEGIGLGQLSASVIDQYLAQRRAAGYVEYRSLIALRPLLDFLAPLGVLPVEEPDPPEPVEELLGRYHDYLVGERGLTARTARGYVDFVRPFVATRAHGDVLDLAGITAAEVTGFVLSACPGRSVGSAKLVVCALRSLLRWLHLSGQVPMSLASAVPSVAGWRLSSLPKGLEPGQLRRLLAGCDRRTGTGRRDYAILLLLSRLGLRAGEVARLGLDDIDWRHGELVVCGKAARIERLPLPADVGAAIAGYLRHGRPATAAGRNVFVRVHAPHRALTTGGVSNVVCDAAQRARLPKMHAHRLRHTAATAMLRAGSTLPEVGQVLRHRSPLTTAIYAKVDHKALAVLARPWPVESGGGVS
ncbi:integrase [Mycobacterium nebraskense]|uniref:Integrase n=1 Tax=Mycobacterium nebraskense TaxID=244292 RepID=A0A1X1ZY99_9MYCO|nr:tyrosine-type recombinase/integrase [Mycobacterium nebraskense]KKC01556.1 integrase [Mycobacterium nebraskense]MCV7118887.1 tyrosine-type recombinase/integrase [Mycobacterium nebraskense]ORW29506.1 integrase [Mycobacterium nebraskense]